MDEQRLQEKLVELQQRYPQCRCDPGEWEEKPTFVKGDRVMLIRDLPAHATLSGIVPTGEALPRGTKGYIFGFDLRSQYFPCAVRFETHSLWLCTLAELERYCAKAVKLDEQKDRGAAPTL